MEQAMEKLKRSISARNSWNGSAKHYKTQNFAMDASIKNNAQIVAEYTADVRNAAGAFIAAYDKYEPYLEKKSVPNLFGAA